MQSPQKAGFTQNTSVAINNVLSQTVVHSLSWRKQHFPATLCRVVSFSQAKHTPHCSSAELVGVAE